MKIRPAYIPNGGAWPFSGIDADSPPALASPKSSPRSNNVEYLRGYISKRRGYRAIGDPILQGATPSTLPVLAVIQFQDQSGNTFTVVADEERQYKLNSGGTGWDDITTGAGPTEWTGDEDNGIQWIIGTDQNGRWLYITNGADMPRRWGGTGDFADISINIPDFVTAKTMAVYGSSLLLANVTTTSVETQTVYWSDTTNFSEFLTGNSGAALLPDTRGAILRLEVLGDRCVVYAEDSVGVITYVGGTSIFAFETLATDIRFLGGRAVCNCGLLHFFMGRENIYAFDGTRGIRPIGDAIRPQYRQLIDLTLSERAFCFNDANENRAWFVAPNNGGDTSTVWTYEYDKTNPLSGRWAKSTYHLRPTAFGYYARLTGLTWADRTDLWSDWPGTWGGIESRAAFPAMAMGVIGDVMLLDGTSLSDRGEIIDASWESVDFTVPNDWPGSLGRWLQIEIEAKGSYMTVSYSLDRGDTWSTGQYIQLTEQPATKRVYVDGVSQTFRVRITSTGEEEFTIHGLRVGVRNAGIT